MGSLVLVKNEINKSTRHFESLSDELKESLSGVTFQLEHIGSTSIPQALTKPVLDVLLIADGRKSQQQIAQKLPGLGFVQGELDKEQTKLFFHREISEPDSFLSSIHLHLIFRDSQNDQDFISLRFRDYLLSHPEEVEAYNENKVMLAKEGNNDRRFYVMHKEKFMKEVLARMEKADSA